MRDTGDARRRSKKPSWMSRARPDPTDMPPNITACVIVAGRMKSRKLSTGGNPGNAVASPNDATESAANTSGNSDGKMTNAICRREVSSERQAMARACANGCGCSP